MVILLLFLSGCLNQQGSQPVPSAPEPKIYPSIPFPSEYIRSSALIDLNVSRQALDSKIHVTVSNTYKSRIEFDTNNILFPSIIPSNKINLGKIVTSLLKDEQLSSCGGLRCNSLYFRAYLKNQSKDGLIDKTNSEFPAAKVYINGIQILAKEENASIIYSQNIPITKTSFSATDLVIHPEFNLELDFSNLDSQAYQGTIQIDYGLKKTLVSDSIPPTINVTSLNQGDILSGGSVQSINWVAADDNLYFRPIRIDYSSDAGSSWTKIDEYILNSGSFLWTLPTIDSENVLVKLTALDSSSNFSSSSTNKFTIDSTKPNIQITNLSNFPKIKGGDPVLINWLASDSHFSNKPIKLEYSPDNGVNWFTIVSRTENTGSYTWISPIIDSQQVKVRATAYDIAGNSSFSDSGTLVLDSSSPSVTLLSLNSTQILKGGSVHEIRWQATDNNFSLNPIKIEYSTDDGVTWSLLSDNNQNSGSFFWTVPAIDSKTVKVRISAIDLVNQSNSAASSSSLEIDSTFPSVVLTSLNSGDFLKALSTKEITWTSQEINPASSPIKLEYSLDSGITWNVISQSIENSGSYIWTIPNVDSGQCKIKISSVDIVGHLTEKTSSGVFTISKGLPDAIYISSGNNQVIPRKLAIPAPLTVLVKDKYAQSVREGTPISFQIVSGGGTLASTVAYTDINGYAQTYYTTGSTAENASISARATKEDGSQISVGFFVQSLDYSPVSISAQSASLLEFSYFNSQDTGITPSGIPYVPVDAVTNSNNSSVFMTINSQSAITNALAANASLINTIGTNLTNDLDPIQFYVQASFPVGVSSGSCSSISAITAIDSLSCTLNTSVGSPGLIIPRGSLNNGTIKFSVKSNNVSPLDTKESLSFSLKRNSIKKISNTSGLNDNISSKPIIFNNLVYFSAKNQNGATKLFSYNSSTNTIVQISNTSNDQFASDNPSNVIIYNNQLFFVAERSPGLRKLYKYCDGSTVMGCGSASIKQLTNIAGNLSDDGIDFVVLTNNSLYFRAQNNIQQDKLYKYCDSSTLCGISGIYQISDLRSGAGDSISAIGAYFGNIYFSAKNPTGFSKMFKYCVDNSCGIQQISNIAGSTLNDNPTNFLVYGLSLYFSAQDSNSRNKLYSYDISNSILKQISNINSTGSDNPRSLSIILGELYFVADTSPGISKLLKYTPLDNKVNKVLDLNPSGSDDVLDFNSYLGNLYISAKSVSGVNKLFRLNPTTKIIDQISNINPSAGDNIQFIAPISNVLYFKGQTGTNVKLFKFCDPSSGCSP